jgi:hypothetical protein
VGAQLFRLIKVDKMSYGLGQTKPNEQMGTTNILKSWGSPHHVGCWCRFYIRPIHPSLLWRNKNIWGRVVSYKIIFCLKYLMATRNCVSAADQWLAAWWTRRLGKDCLGLNWWGFSQSAIDLLELSNLDN